MRYAKEMKFAVMLSLAIIAILFMVSPQFTGWVVDTLKIDIGVATDAQGCLYFLNNESWVFNGSDMNFTLHLDNCGNQLLGGMINLVIRNSTQDVNESNSSVYSLNVFESFVYNFTWNATQPLGYYYAIAKDNYTNETIETNMSFYVTSCQPGSYQCFNNTLMRCDLYDWSFREFCEAGCVNGACLPVIEPGRAPAIPSKSFSVDAPTRLEMYSNSNQTFLIKVKNTGSMIIYNLSIEMKHENLTARTSPESVILSTGSSVMFYVELDATGVEPNDYQIFWTVAGDEIKKHGYITVTVLTAPIGTECKESIEYYLGIMDVLKKQINDVAAEGKNVTLARKLFDETVYELMAAQTYYKMGNNQECIDRISTVRTNIERIVIELAYAKPEPIMLLLPVVYQMIFWAVVSVVVIVIVFYLSRKLVSHTKERKKKRKLMLPKRWR